MLFCYAYWIHGILLQKEVYRIQDVADGIDVSEQFVLGTCVDSSSIQHDVLSQQIC